MIRSEINSYMNCDIASKILSDYGVNLDHNCMFKLRDERTPSIKLYPDGHAFDFGTRDHYRDIVSLLFDGIGGFNSISECEAVISSYIDTDSMCVIPRGEPRPLDEIHELLEKEARNLLDNTELPDCVVSGRVLTVKGMKCKVAGSFNKKSSDHYIINSIFEKLFEGTAFDGVHAPRLQYVMKHVLGYDTANKCPAIVLRDNAKKVADIVRYRCCEDKYKGKSSDYSGRRSKDWLFPFQTEMEMLADKSDFIIVGEGLKNALNALVYGEPFISLESSSSEVSDRLIEFIKQYKNKKIYLAFDPDSAGGNMRDRFISKYDGETSYYFPEWNTLDYAEYKRKDVL